MTKDKPKEPDKPTQETTPKEVPCEKAELPKRTWTAEYRYGLWDI